MGLFGGGSSGGEKLARQQAEAAQRRQMAELARAAAEADQAKAGTSGKRRGRTLLTFLGSSGQQTLG